MKKHAFAIRLRRLREAAGLTQTELAEKCGVVPSFVNHFERARRLPAMRTLQRLADGLGVSLSEFDDCANGKST